MSSITNIGFLTSSRADFGKLKPIIADIVDIPYIDLTIFVTGMHLQNEMGNTIAEIEKSFKNNYRVIPGQKYGESQLTGMARLLTNIENDDCFNNLDYIIIHGDRIEALAVSVAAKFRNLSIIHIEGGERSGSIDELIRHSVTKFSDFHLVTNNESRNRVIQLGESKNNVWVTGSPESSMLLNNDLPDVNSFKSKYDIYFEDYVVLAFHPVVNSPNETDKLSLLLKDIITNLKYNFIIIGSNSDDGFEKINKNIPLYSKKNIKYFPSIRFEYYLTLLKNASLVIGNSSSFVREAPVFGIPSVIPGTRQKKRTVASSVFFTDTDYDSVVNVIKNLPKSVSASKNFGCSKSLEKIKTVLMQIFESTENTSVLKEFNDL